MPTNEERQIVAYSLRNLASYREVDKELVEDVLDLYMGECVDGYDPVSVVHVADLIDPEPERTCNVIFRSHELSQTQTALVKSCSLCGFEFGTEIKNTFPFEVTINSISIPNYCPNCGAKVIDDANV